MKILLRDKIFFGGGEGIKMCVMTKLFPMQSCAIMMDFPPASIERF